MKKTGLLVLTLFAQLYAGDSSAAIRVLYSDSKTGPNYTCMDSKTMRAAPCPDTALFSLEGTNIVEKAFSQSDFVKLDETFNKWCTGRDRFPDGLWKLSKYSDGLSGNFQAWQDWDGALNKIRKWQTKMPQSFAAKYAESVYWRDYAWKARGNAYASSTSDDAWAVFKTRLKKADAILETLRPRAGECPIWYSTKINTMLEMGADKADIRKVFDAGVKKFPEYHSIYFSMARTFSPKWGGSELFFDKFARAMTKQTEKFEGTGMYSRLYWTVDNESGIPYKLDSQYPDYKLLKPGFEDLMKKYPDSLHNLNHYVSVVCRSNDRQLYRKLRTLIEPSIEEEQFSSLSIDACDHRHGVVLK